MQRRHSWFVSVQGVQLREFLQPLIMWCLMKVLLVFQFKHLNVWISRSMCRETWMLVGGSWKHFGNINRYYHLQSDVKWQLVKSDKQIWASFFIKCISETDEETIVIVIVIAKKILLLRLRFILFLNCDATADRIGIANSASDEYSSYSVLCDYQLLFYAPWYSFVFHIRLKFILLVDCYMKMVC